MKPAVASTQQEAPLRRARLAAWVLVGTWGLAGFGHLLSAPGVRSTVWPLEYMLLEILATVSLAVRAWNCRGPGRAAWWLLSASAVLEVPNLALTWFQQQGVISAQVGALSSLFTLATGFLVLAGVLSFPRGAERGARFRRRLLDALLFAAAVLFVLWVMGVQGSLGRAPQGIGLRVVAGYLNLALLGGGLVFMTSYDPDRARGPLGWLGASALAWLAALACWTLDGLPSAVSAEPWILLAGGIPVFQGLAAWSPQRVDEVMAGTMPPRGAAALLPYLPAALAMVVMGALLAGSPRSLTPAAMAVFLTMVILLLVRQFLAIQDLQVARQTLEDRVRQRSDALEQAQQTLLRTERMNTLALMGAGLAHDLNNLLGAVKASAELAVLNLEEGQTPGVTDLNRMAAAADRAAMLTRRLMEFARRKDEALLPLDLVQALADMETTLRLLVPRTVAFSLVTDGAGPLVVETSLVRLEQMMVNLVANAIDAMPEGGSLRILLGRGGAGRDQAQVEVVDTGTGMDPETVKRIFDPFFTTKAPGRGTGLGLSSLKALVEEGGGSLEVDSRPGRGSRFRICLPLSAATALNPR